MKLSPETKVNPAMFWAGVAAAEAGRPRTDCPHYGFDAFMRAVWLDGYDTASELVEPEASVVASSSDRAPS